MYSDGPPHMAEQKQDDQLGHSYSSYVKIRDVALKTCQRNDREKRRERSGISVLAARHDDDDDDEISNPFYAYVLGIYDLEKKLKSTKLNFHEYCYVSSIISVNISHFAIILIPHSGQS